MEFRVETREPRECDLVIVPVFAEWPEGDRARAGERPHVTRLFRSGEFAGDAKEMLVLHRDERPIEAVLGLGAREKADLDVLRRAVGAAVRRAKALRLGALTVAISREVAAAVTKKLPAGVPAGERLGRAVFDATLLADYEFDRYQPKRRKEDAKRPGPTAVGSMALYVEGEEARGVTEAARVASVLERAVRTARDLGNLPGNEGTPSELARRAREMAAEAGLGCEVLERTDMERLGMGALLGVARGSEEPPKLIVLSHRPLEAVNAGRPIALVGKAVTFDSGGISIKPSENMEEMRFDKCGGAAVIGALEALARLGVPLEVTGIVPSTENLPSGRSYKPGDVLRAADGQTIEVNNTDAEGRLILADALAYAVESVKPSAIVDLATLTGAIVVALGSLYAGLFGNDDALLGELRCASAGAGERIWPMPAHDDEYDERLKSWLADVKNSPGRPGGAVTAARFLKRFVKDVPWAHIDIAGTAWITEESAHLAKGATGFGVRLLVDWLRTRGAAGAR